MHPIWFVKWVWEKAWSADGLLPLFEHNQGTLSVTALALALIAFLVETRRANEAKAEAESAREAQRQADEERRTAAIREAREADEARRLNHLLDFITTVNGIIAEVQRDIVIDRLALADEVGKSGIFPSPLLRAKARIGAGAINAILTSAPPIPKAVFDARQASEKLEWLGGLTPPPGDDWMDLVDLADDDLTKIKGRMSDHHRALMAELRPQLAAAFAAQSGAIEVEDNRNL